MLGTLYGDDVAMEDPHHHPPETHTFRWVGQRVGIRAGRPPLPAQASIRAPPGPTAQSGRPTVSVNSGCTAFVQ